MRPIERRTKNVPLNVATHLPITKGERIHFYQNSIPPCKGYIKMCSKCSIPHFRGFVNLKRIRRLELSLKPPYPQGFLTIYPSRARGSAPHPLQAKKPPRGLCLNTDYNLDTTAEAVQKAVHSMILILLITKAFIMVIGSQLTPLRLAYSFYSICNTIHTYP